MWKLAEWNVFALLILGCESATQPVVDAEQTAATPNQDGDTEARQSQGGRSFYSLGMSRLPVTVRR